MRDDAKTLGGTSLTADEAVSAVQPGQLSHAAPLFVPLKAEFFEAFADGRKTDELRRYGPRWNERTCAVGRDVVLSKGYGKAQRLRGRIWKFKKQHGSTFGSTYRTSIERVFGTLDIEIACISIELVEEFCLGCSQPTDGDCGCPAGTGWRRRAVGSHGKPVVSEASGSAQSEAPKRKASN